MDNLIVELLQLRVFDDVFKHCAVFNLGNADDSRSFRGYVGFHTADGESHVVNFAPVLVAVPLTLSVRRKLKVVFTIIINGVK